MKTIFLIITLLFLIGCKENQFENIDFSGYCPKSVELIKSAIPSLQKFKPSADTPQAKFRKSDKGYPYPTYRIDGDGAHGAEGEGMIKFSAESWIYILLVSSWHEEENMLDITLAIDNRGNLWFNGGHVCGGITFESKLNKKAVSPEDFFNHFQGMAKGIKWKKININTQQENPE